MLDKEKNTFSKRKPLIILAPLDWGLGHTTRCIPLISEFKKNGCNIIVACNSTQKLIFSSEFPDLDIVELRGWEMGYGKTATSTKLKLLLQSRKILTKIKEENRWLQGFLDKNKADAVISDNRYGFYSAGIPSILITHQLSLRSGFGSLADRLIRFFLQIYISKFSECWVPDFREAPGIAGALSHPLQKPSVPVQYLGCLSRFRDCIPALPDYEYDLIIILSGPEPQRTIFENILLKQLPVPAVRTVIVRGLPGENSLPMQSSGVMILNHADAATLNNLICSSRMVICRAGYTGIMDMIRLRKKMIVVPTPGQGEQEYLGRHMSSTKRAIVIDQQQFSIEEAIKKAASFAFDFGEAGMEEYKTVIRNFVQQLNANPTA